MYFDSHAHYDSEAFDDGRAALLAALPGAGVEGVVNCGCDLMSSRRSVELAEQYPWFYAAVGLHPDAADTLTDAALSELRALLQSPRAVAVGEIGLDYHYPDGPDRAVQQRAFRRQLELARELGKPVICHVRDAVGDAMEIVREFSDLRGVFHCFSGSAETAQELVQMGWYVGFTGVLTFKNARRAAEAVRAVPLERLLLETDCPYMAPEPNRGKRCDSRMLAFTCARMAELRGLPPEQMAAVTARNARRFFGLEGA